MKKEYFDKNKAWLAAKVQEPGVKPLDGGIYFKVLKSGNKDSRTPNRGSVVTVHYPRRKGLWQAQSVRHPHSSTLIFVIDLVAVH